MRCERTEKSYLDASVFLPEELKGILLKGLEQTNDSLPPQVEVVRRFRPFIEDSLATKLQSRRFVSLIADTQSEQSANSLDYTNDSGVLAVGPELGWNDFEREAFAQLGFQSISLGQRIMRIETAVTALLGRILL